MTIEQSDAEFYETVVAKIDGWLEPFAAIRTMDILTFQEARKMPGGLLEIGVFHGRYFSLLARSAARTGALVLGIDTFQYNDINIVRQMCATYPSIGPADISLWQRRSDACSGEEIRRCLDGSPRFISIDGSHEKDIVYLDLKLTETLSNENTLIALDDFLNPLTIGVNEAAHAFFASPRAIVPIAYMTNKLFLAHRVSSMMYKSAFEDFIVKDTSNAISELFRQRREKSRGFVEQPLWGNHIIVV